MADDLPHLQCRTSRKSGALIYPEPLGHTSACCGMTFNFYSYLLEAESIPGPQCGRKDYVNARNMQRLINAIQKKKSVHPVGSYCTEMSRCTVNRILEAASKLTTKQCEQKCRCHLTRSGNSHAGHITLRSRGPVAPPPNPRTIMQGPKSHFIY